MKLTSTENTPCNAHNRTESIQLVAHWVAGTSLNITIKVPGAWVDKATIKPLEWARLNTLVEALLDKVGDLVQYGKDQMDYMRQRIQEMFRISSELGDAFPGRKFTLDGHLVGSIGEVIAAYHYNLQLFPSSVERHDATASNGRLVQVKTTQGMHGIAMRSEPEYLIVLWLDSNTGEVREVYNGPGAPIWYVCGKLASNGTRPITMSKLRMLAAQVAPDQRIEPWNPILKF